MRMSWKRYLLGVPEKEFSFSTRGFEPCDAPARNYLENIIREFVDGYHLALTVRDHKSLVSQLDKKDKHHVGFAYEGTGMYFALLDLVMPWGPSRLRMFTESSAIKHDYIVSVGAGFAVGKLPWGVLMLERYMHRLHPLKAWCVPDGYGFYQGIFHHKRYIEQCQAPSRHIPQYAHQLFDSGIGRSLWWVKASSPERIKQAIDRFPGFRQAELWCGIGVACAYAGGVTEEVLRKLYEYSGIYLFDFLSGIPFAATMRLVGENSSPCTELACRVLLSKTIEEAANMADQALADQYVEDMPEEEIREQGYSSIREHLVDQMKILVKTAQQNASSVLVA